MSEEDASEINDRIEAVREALKGTDAGVDRLHQAAARRGAAAGRDEGLRGGRRPSGGDGSGGRQGRRTGGTEAAPEEEGETIEGEYKEV